VNTKNLRILFWTIGGITLGLLLGVNYGVIVDGTIVLFLMLGLGAIGFGIGVALNRLSAISRRRSQSTGGKSTEGDQTH